jgi:hypothetical protein
LEANIGLDWQGLAKDRDMWMQTKARAAIRQWASIFGSAWVQHAHKHPAPHISTRLERACPNIVLKGVSIMCATDNMQVAKQVSGLWPTAPEDPYYAYIQDIRWILHALKVRNGLTQWPGFVHPIWHWGRENNTLADAFANQAQDFGDFRRRKQVRLQNGDKLLICTDGACRQSGLCSVGICIFLFRDDAPPVRILEEGRRVAKGTSVSAEFEGALLGLHAFVEGIGTSYFPAQPVTAAGGS